MAGDNANRKENKRQYDDEAAMAGDSGRRRNDNIGIVHIFQEMNVIKGAVNKLQQSVNNGLLERTEKNTQAIEDLSCEVNDIKQYIHEKEGGEKTLDKVIKYGGAFGGGVITALGIGWYILQYLGVL